MKLFEKLKEKFKKDKPELGETYQKYLEELKCGTAALYDGFNILLKGKKNEEKLNEVISSEHKADRLKEKYIETLFKTKRALPFLIEDRYKIINNLDSISDKSEEISHFILLYPYNVYASIKEEMKNLNKLCFDSVCELIDMVDLMENNFNKAYQKTFYIENIKREGRAVYYKLLAELFTYRENALRVYLTSKLIVWLFEIISKVEEISDYLRGLIIKYPNK
ncbi:MAG: DUF47 family protein [Promethearchaeia archaeon]